MLLKVVWPVSKLITRLPGNVRSNPESGHAGAWLSVPAPHRLPLHPAYCRAQYHRDLHRFTAAPCVEINRRAWCHHSRVAARAAWES